MLNFSKEKLLDKLFSGTCLILLATFLLSFRSILVKFAYTEKIAIMDLFYFRFLFTIPLLLIFSYSKKGKKLFKLIMNKEIFVSCLLAGFFGYYLATLLDFHALALIDANISRIILYSFPIYVLAINHIIKKTLPTAKEIIIFIIVQIALFFVLGGFNFHYSQINKLGALLSLFSAFSYALYIIINQETGKKIGSILFTTYAVCFSFIFINIHYFLSYEPLSTTEFTLKSCVIIIVMAIFCTFLPLLLISEAIKKIGAAKFALINSLGPVMTIILCYITLNETLNLSQILGSVIIIITLYLAETTLKKS